MARILIATQNDMTAAYVAGKLKKTGYSIDTSDNSLDTWRKGSHGGYDAVLIDIAMQGIDSFILAQRALMENPQAQIVFITGFSGVAMDTYATPSYAPAPVTTRPFHLSEIKARLSMLLFHGALPVTTYAATTRHEDNIVYANFGARAAQASAASTQI